MLYDYNSNFIKFKNWYFLKTVNKKLLAETFNLPIFLNW